MVSDNKPGLQKKEVLSSVLKKDISSLNIKNKLINQIISGIILMDK
jgi:hypothetical protein